MSTLRRAMTGMPILMIVYFQFSLRREILC